MWRTSSTPWVLLIACGPADPALLESTSPTEPHEIVGGRAFRGLPAIGAITYDGEPECTGTLIAARRVLTAAHCLEDADITTMGFVVGPSAYAPEVGSGIAAAFLHPDYDSETLASDIGWLLLAQDIPARPLGVVESMSESWLGRSLLFVGYGIAAGAAVELGDKRAVSMTVDELYDTEFWYGDDQRNVCDGDSGGPALHKLASGEYLVVGVTSAGDEHCAEFGVSTRVDAFLDFLEIEGGPISRRRNACRGETFAGRCEGSTLIWCEGESVHRMACDEVCGWAGPAGFDCVARNADPCDGETYFGRCDGDRLVWCDGESAQARDCDVCGLEGPAGYNCL